MQERVMSVSDCLVGEGKEEDLRRIRDNGLLLKTVPGNSTQQSQDNGCTATPIEDVDSVDSPQVNQKSFTSAGSSNLGPRSGMDISETEHEFRNS